MLTAPVRFTAAFNTHTDILLMCQLHSLTADLPLFLMGFVFGVVKYGVWCVEAPKSTSLFLTEVL